MRSPFLNNPSGLSLAGPLDSGVFPIRSIDRRHSYAKALSFGSTGGSSH